jgi:hypothetical protein
VTDPVEVALDDETSDALDALIALAPDHPGDSAHAD